MAISNIKEMLGTGIYSVSEAALYARISTGMMARWLFGNSKGKAVLESQYQSSEKVVSFLDLVQTLAIREIRQQHRINLKKIREAIKEAKEKHGMQYPFAMQHYTHLLGERIVINPPGSGLIEASGKHRGQRLFAFVELYLKNLSFDPNGVANAYTIFKHDNISIEMKPGIRFGEPLLPSGYTARVIRESISAEGGIEEAARAYGIPPSEAEASYLLFDHLWKPAA